ncbi:MAG: MotA/TolQ/ExbB proton channel family protein [Planctomycetaceae bacterium]|jgi:biopolymer transport protein ExbB|nr:MotA/TolQ/ExbB proton channel family protein [Planctomycetaceae bacterium]
MLLSLFSQAEAANIEAIQPVTQGLLSWYISACGVFFAPLFLLISVIFVALAVMNWLAVSRNSIVPPQMLADFDVKIEAKQYQEAYETARSSDSAIGQILAAGLTKMAAGYKIAEQAVSDAAEEEVMRLEHRLSYLGTIASVTPMIGLLGTVWGMVDAFSVIARSGAAPNASQLAGGISLALVTTQIGLVIAIPALVLFEILKNRLSRFVLELNIQTDLRMERFKSAGLPK